ncbi:sulfite exporter TauE/SafE family protein [Leifsonia sp. YIM 134122]|uniref:Probable membrane transporter protein n=1 Tax=Leifsonia stereocauli TaxID=3134136 RepID=A0ABU9W814_9MICO
MPTTMSAIVVTVLTCASVLVGAAAQRITGLGFALVAAPLLVASVGPVAGVSMGNVLSAVLCVVVLASAWRFVDWKRALLLTLPALVAIPVGVAVTRVVPTAPLMILVGSIALLAIATVAFSQSARVLPGRRGAVVAGGLSGFMSATAGVGGPALAVHAFSDRWPRQVFLGTGQAFLLVTNLVAVGVKGVPAIDGWLWLAAVISLGVGILIGQVLAPRVSDGLGRTLVIGLAAVGSAAAIVRGILLL